MPEQFDIVHPWSVTRAADDVEVLYAVEGSPALVRRGVVSAWDPADVHHRVIIYSGQWDFGRHNVDRSVHALMGSSYPFLIPAREINRVLRSRDRFSVEDLAPDSPLAVAAWRSGDGAIRILVGEVDEGFRDSTDGDWPLTAVVPGFSQTLQTTLTYGQSRLFAVSAEGIAAQWRP